VAPGGSARVPPEQEGERPSEHDENSAEKREEEPRATFPAQSSRARRAGRAGSAPGGPDASDAEDDEHERNGREQREPQITHSQHRLGGMGGIHPACRFFAYWEGIDLLLRRIVTVVTFRRTAKDARRIGATFPAVFVAHRRAIRRTVGLDLAGDNGRRDRLPKQRLGSIERKFPSAARNSRPMPRKIAKKIVRPTLPIAPWPEVPPPEIVIRIARAGCQLAPAVSSAYF